MTSDTHLPQKKDKDMFLLVQVWRALAAFLVLFGHTQHEAIEMAKQAGENFAKISFNNGVGVDIFFVISGFVIVYASRSLIGKRDTWAEFLRRRIIRVVPTYWAFTTLMVIVLLIMPHAVQSTQFEYAHVLLSYLFIPHLNPMGEVYPVLSLGWTLNYEMYFYVVFAVLIFLPLNRLISIMVVFFITTTLLWPFIPAEFVPLKFWSSPYILEFLTGALIAWARMRGIRLPECSLYPLIALGFVLLFALYIVPKMPFIFLDPEICKPILRELIGAVFVIAGTLPAQAGQFKPPKILCDLGDSSYALYLSHPFSIGVCKIIWSKLAAGALLNLWLFIGLTMAVSIIAAHFVFLWFEKPVIGYLRTKTRKSEP